MARVSFQNYVNSLLLMKIAPFVIQHLKLGVVPNTLQSYPITYNTHFKLVTMTLSQYMDG
jgi:hypothetical protein